jgi:cell cycle sensor histidine kinase DivJ
MSRIETGRYRLEAESFAVGEVIRECTAMLGLEVERRGLTLTTRVPKACGMVVADRRAVKQILINLVGNAAKFTGAGGVVTVDAVRLGQTMRFVVADTGAGMEPELLERIGQPFVQGEADYANHHEGTGLGLCLVKGLVALHGGTMAIDSAPGRGTAITIDLPLDGSGIVDPQEEKTTATAFPPRLKRNEEPQTHDAGKNDAAKKTA